MPSAFGLIRLFMGISFLLVWELEPGNDGDAIIYCALNCEMMTSMHLQSGYAAITRCCAPQPVE
jgi:hypothetical protein